MRALRTACWVAAALLIGAVGDARAQGRPPDPVHPEGFVSAEAVAPGDSFRIAVKLGMDKNWHTHSNTPSDPRFIATKIELALPEGLETVEQIYPSGLPLDAPALGGALSVYEDGVLMGAVIRVADEVAEGPIEMIVKLRYQACNDTLCLFPKNEEIPLEIRVDSTAGAPLHEAIFAALAVGDAHEERAAVPTGKVAEQIRESGFSLWLLGVFVLGLGLNLTPCVYPVIAVTISFFGRQGGSTAGRALHSAAYSSGIMAMFTGLFLVAGLSGQLFGAWLQNPLVLGALSIVLVVLALSNFGLFELQAPAFIRNRVAGGRSGVAGAFLMGLAMGIVAAPCVGPLIAGLLIWVGQQGSMVQAGLVGFSLSLGLALPYFVLGMFSGSLGSMPGSGAWMDWVKHLMGFVLLGVALYFLTPVIPDTWFLPSFALLIGVAAVFLVFFDRAGRGSRVMLAARVLVLVVAVVGILGLTRLQTAEGIRWEPYSTESLASAAGERQPVMIEFTADWCVPCRVMQYGAFKDAGVIAESERFVRLRVDLTHQQDPIAVEAVERFGVAGPPTIVFLDGGGDEIADLRVVESLAADELLERMREVPASTTASL